MNEALEALNGSWAILAGYAFLFTVMHLHALVRYGDKTFRQWVFDLGFQLAIAAGVISCGILLTRAAIWYWRFMTGGDLSQLSEQGLLLGVGATIGSAGFLLYIRVITRPFGWPPVVVTVMTVVLYLATFLLDAS